MNMNFSWFFLFLLVGVLNAQNMTLPTDILQSLKTSFEAAGAGSINLGPMGAFGSIAGQFGIKVNKEETTSGNTANLVRINKRSISEMNPLLRKMINRVDADQKDRKNCFSIPIYIPVVRVAVTAAPPTPTAGAPDARGDSTTVAA